MDHEALTVPCAYCGAQVGEWCRTADSGIRIAARFSHDSRWDQLHPGVPLTTVAWPAQVA